MTDDQFEQFMAVLTSIAESFRILCDEIEEQKHRAAADEEG